MSITPFYIDDLERLREKLARAERDGSTLGRVWSAVRRRARVAPDDFPWFAPLVALVSNEERDLEAARCMIRSYLRTLDVQPFGAGLQFHFWCFAFPHARWALYFQWLLSQNAWDESEARALCECFVVEQFTNFFFGMRNKPEPDCVDNQSMSLCFSNALVGHLFSSAPFESATARRMYSDGARRLPDMIGGMPPSGYSGEGSTYMDGVVGPAIPFLVELLERTRGGDWFNRVLEPHGGSAASICRMIAREWMPGGLLLPWDHYGYSLPMRSCIAYAARREGGIFRELLENHASWSHDGMIGWGFDDLIWSLVWWPEKEYSGGKVFTSWAQPQVGAALVSEDAQLYLMQMWDETEPVFPTRQHCNPNAIILNAYGVPLCVDGIPREDCMAFNYDDTWREVSYMDLNSRRFNFGAGCGGAHSVLLIDGWEGMRAMSHFPQAEMQCFDGESNEVLADVTPLYRERFTDAIRVARRSRLCENRFWIIEDLAQFETEREVTARWWLRPQQRAAAHGITLETAEGILLRLLPLVGPDEKTVQLVEDYPRVLDGMALRCDWTQRGKNIHWLWLAWPENTRREVEDISQNWQVAADEKSTLNFIGAHSKLQKSRLRLSFTAPADMNADVPLCRRWWYRKTVRVPDAKNWWIRLPRQMIAPRLWINGKEISLSEHELRMNLLEPHIAMPSTLKADDEIEIIVRCDVGVSQYRKEDNGGTGFSGRPGVLVAQPETEIEARFENSKVLVRADDESWEIEHELLNLS